jgi:uncharacterized lipoprotein YmbA
MTGTRVRGAAKERPRSFRRPGPAACSALLALLLVAGCAGPVDRYHTLRPANAAAASSTHNTDRVLTVGPVTLPEALDRAGWVVRTGDTSVQVYQHQLWTQGLDAEIAQTLAEQLNRALAASTDEGARAIWADGSPPSPAVDPTLVPPHALRVRVQVLRFDSLLAPSPAISDALRWTLECTGGESARDPALLRFHVLRSAVREVTAPAAAGSPGVADDDTARRFDRLALAHAAAVQAVAADVAAAIVETAADRAQACPDTP